MELADRLCSWAGGGNGLRDKVNQLLASYGEVDGCLLTHVVDEGLVGVCYWDRKTGEMVSITATEEGFTLQSGVMKELPIVDIREMLDGRADN